MDQGQTTAAIQRYLIDLAAVPGDCAAAPEIRALLERAVNRLQFLCSSLLYKSYPRLTQGPLNLQTDELLSAVVERMIKALQKVRPENVRGFFALVNQHVRWELNDLARRLDERSADVESIEQNIAASESSDSIVSPNAVRMLDAIESLPDDEREVFCLIRIQEMMQVEVAELLGISIKTVQRRLNRSLLLLEVKLSDLRPEN